MKKLIFILSLLIMTVSAKAALFIANNTDCDIEIKIKAHDPNNALCGLHSVWIPITAWNALSFGNLTSVNNPPTAYGWSGGYTAASGLPPAVWAWDAVEFTATSGGTWSGEVGNPGICSNVNSQVFPSACNGMTVSVTWIQIGSNVFVSFDY